MYINVIIYIKCINVYVIMMMYVYGKCDVYVVTSE